MAKIKRQRLTHDGENNRECNETHQLNRFATPLVDEKEADPVSRNQATCRQDQVPHADVLEVLEGPNLRGGRWSICAVDGPKSYSLKDAP